MGNTFQKIKEYIQINNMFHAGDRLVLGVSGGCDSIALFRVLYELKEEYGLNLFVVHIHHGIRKEADEDAAFVEDLCKKRKIPFYLFKEDIRKLAKQQGKTEEEAGRDYRYFCFCEVAKQVSANKIVVAHHENDQTETVLFHLMRGTDLQGLKGMEPVSSMQNGVYVLRPLLCMNRKEIEHFLQELGETWREDATNLNNSYARNAVRNIIIPAMENINEQTVFHIARLSGQISEYEAFLNTQVHHYLEEHLEYSKTQTEERLILNRHALQKEEPIFIKKILYEMLSLISGQKKNLKNEHVEALYALLYNQSGKRLDLPYGIGAFLVYENLILGKSLEEEFVASDALEDIFLDNIVWKENAVYNINRNGYGRVEIVCATRSQFADIEKNKAENSFINNKNDYTKYFDCDTIEDTLCIRLPNAEDYICINENGNQKKLSKFFKDEKIEIDRRKKIPLLALNQEILYVMGVRRCERYKVKENTKKIMIVSYEGEKNGLH